MNVDKDQFLLTFELDNENDLLEIHGNAVGLKNLRDMIDFLINKSDQDHVHLMSPAFGGEDLSDKKCNLENNMINHVKIFKWNGC